MIFIANVLVMNGGTTFLIRTCRKLSAQGEACVVLLLRPNFDAQLRNELERYARVVCLQDYLLDRGLLFRAHTAVFGPINWRALGKALGQPALQAHAMGVFGLIFAARMEQHGIVARTTVGVYHQNEFLFRPPPFFFPREAIRLFAALPASNVVFFNEGTRSNYERFFGASYQDSSVVPIGIELPGQATAVPSTDSARIVSVGNLVGFKTYNRHIVEMLPALVAQFPNLVYEIYGDGPERKNLEELVATLALQHHVIFKGTIPYQDFHQAIAGAQIFVGSGTALIEAAALGVPALIGIESINAPRTYGFLSDIHGLTYNEDVPSQKKQDMQPLVERILSDAEYRTRVSIACKNKAAEFSVGTTTHGLLALNSRAQPGRAPYLGRLRRIRMMCSLLGLALLERMGWNSTFSKRRDQSF